MRHSATAQLAVAKSIPNYLRLYRENTRPAPGAKPEALTCLPDLCQAFEKVTGWPLRYVSGQVPLHDLDLLWSAPVNPGVGIAPGHLRIEVDGGGGRQGGPRTDLDSAGRLVDALADLMVQVLQAQHALWQREAELAAGVPLVPHRDGERHLALRLEAVLRAGALALDCQAAALYLLNDGTSELKLRSSWGLPFTCYTAPPRPLADALADLEAMAGHAIVLDGTASPAWNAPEPFSSAVCVPVSSPTVVLGTLWLFSGRPRQFSDQQVNMAEVVAGRLASDLEREMLLADGIDAATWKQKLAAAQRLQQNQLPRIAPLAEEWDFAGWACQAHEIGGGFYDWFTRPDDSLAVALGDCSTTGLPAMLLAGAARAALRAHGECIAEPGQVLERVNRTLWTGTAGDAGANLFYATLAAAGGRLRFAAAGHAGALLIRRDGWRSLAEPVNAVGLAPDSSYVSQQCLLEVGDALAIVNEAICSAGDQHGRPLGHEALARALTAQLEAPAEVLAQLAREQVESHAAGPAHHDQALLVVKRRKESKSRTG